MTLESRGVNSKMQKQLADKFEVEKKTSNVLRTIRELESSLSAARINFERARNAYQSHWGEEQCCRVHRVELSNIVNQLAISKEETGATKKELNTLKELFENCQEQKLKQANILERVEIKLQAANKQLDEQSKEFKNIRTDLLVAYQDIAEMLSEDGIRGEPVWPSMSSTSTSIPNPLEGITDITELLAQLTLHV